MQAACSALAPSVQLLQASPVYETPPWGFLDQPAFLNQVLQAETGLPPLDLLAFLKDLETELGRQPNFRYGPRLIDMDILLYDDLVLSLPGLEIPHPRLAERAFVLVPLADLAPDLCYPGKWTIRWLPERIVGAYRARRSQAVYASLMLPAITGWIYYFAACSLVPCQSFHI